jgi:hypothetical protein
MAGRFASGQGLAQPDADWPIDPVVGQPRGQSFVGKTRCNAAAFCLETFGCHNVLLDPPVP